MGSYIKLALAAISNVFGYFKQKMEISNDPALKQAKSAQIEQDQKDKGNRTIAGAAKGNPKDLQDLRNDIGD